MKQLSFKHSLARVLFLLLMGPAFWPSVYGVSLGNIWPLGDSITYGANYAGGYRETLYTNLTARGYSLTLVGTLTSNPTTLLSSAGQTHHDGHSGYSITNAVNLDGTSRSGIYEGVVSWHTTITTPDVILLMIGINDLNTDYEIDTAPARLDLLVTRLFGYFPNTRLLVSTLIDASPTNGFRHEATNNIAVAVSNYNTGIVSVVANHRAAGQKIVLVDMHEGLTLADLSDGLHPSSQGYVKMGKIWADAVVASPPQFGSRAVAVSGGVVTLTATGALHTSYSLWAATNLTTSTWTLVTNGDVATNPFTIRNAATNSWRFFRFGAP